MPSRDNEPVEVDNPEARKAFGRKILKTVLFERFGQGFDPVHLYRFQALDMLKDVGPPQIPAVIPKILRDRNHGMRIQMPDGPLVFMRKKNDVSIIEPATMLLNPDRRLRRAV